MISTHSRKVLIAEGPLSRNPLHLSEQLRFLHVAIMAATTAKCEVNRYQNVWDGAVQPCTSQVVGGCSSCRVLEQMNGARKTLLDCFFPLSITPSITARPSSLSCPLRFCPQRPSVFESCMVIGCDNNEKQHKHTLDSDGAQCLWQLFVSRKARLAKTAV